MRGSHVKCLIADNVPQKQALKRLLLQCGANPVEESPNVVIFNSLHAVHHPTSFRRWLRGMWKQGIHFLGNVCVKEALQQEGDGTTLPRALFPLYSLALAGVVVCNTVGVGCAAFEAKMAHRIACMGGTYTTHWDARVTHVVANNIHSRIYKQSANLTSVHRVRPTWVQCCWRRQVRVPESHHSLPALLDCVISVTGLSPSTRQSLTPLIASHGATYSGDLTRHCTHLVARDASGLKYRYALAWGVHVVSLDWLLQSMNQGATLDERLFPPPSLTAPSTTDPLLSPVPGLSNGRPLRSAMAAAFPHLPKVGALFGLGATPTLPVVAPSPLLPSPSGPVPSATTGSPQQAWPASAPEQPHRRHEGSPVMLGKRRPASALALCRLGRSHHHLGHHGALSLLAPASSRKRSRSRDTGRVAALQASSTPTMTTAPNWTDKKPRKEARDCPSIEDFPDPSGGGGGGDKSLALHPQWPPCRRASPIATASSATASKSTTPALATAPTAPTAPPPPTTTTTTASTLATSTTPSSPSSGASEYSDSATLLACQSPPEPYAYPVARGECTPTATALDKSTFLTQLQRTMQLCDMASAGFITPDNVFPLALTAYRRGVAPVVQSCARYLALHPHLLHGTQCDVLPSSLRTLLHHLASADAGYTTMEGADTK